MLLLAIDTAADFCAALVLDAGRGIERGRAVEAMRTGHAERLMDAIAEALDRSGASFRDLGAVAASVGPGSFTGVRVGVSTARGLALALGVPAVGVSTLEALAAQARAEGGAAPVLVVLEGGRGEVFAQGFDRDGRALRGPAAVDAEEAARWAAEDGTAVLAGTAAGRVRALLPSGGPEIGPAGATADIRFFALCAAAAGGKGAAPKPLYLRAPDAEPARDPLGLDRRA